MLDFLLGPRRRAQTGDVWTEGWMPLGTGFYNQGAFGNRQTSAGVTVNEDSALTYSAVWCASRVLSETPAMLPLLTYERVSEEDRRRAYDFSLYDILHTSPNPEMSSMPFREGRCLHQVNCGNGFAEIQRQGDQPTGDVEALWPIHPWRVRPSRPGEKYEGGQEIPAGTYVVSNNDGSSTALLPYQMLHVPGVMSEDGIWGKGVISYAAEAIGMGLATEEHGANYFGSGGQPRGIVFGPGMKDPEQRRQFRREWKEIHGAPDAGNIAILPIEAKYQAISLNNEEGQFLESRGFNVLEIARFYRLPPHFLASLVGASYNSIEVMSLEFVIYSLLPWLKRWEEQLALKLLSRQERRRYYFEHLVAGLLRGDLKSRMDAYKVAIMMGVMTINDVRRLENLNNIGPDGDVHYVPMNMTTAERMRTGDIPQQRRGMGSEQTGTSARQYRKLKAQLRQIRGQASASTPDVQPVGLSQGQLLVAARYVLEDALHRMVTKEANAVQRAIKDPNFESWLDGFYEKHEKILAGALAPSLAVLAAAGKKTNGEILAHRLAAESKQELLFSYNHESRQRMAERLERWPAQRVELLATKILEGRYEGAYP